MLERLTGEQMDFFSMISVNLNTAAKYEAIAQSNKSKFSAFADDKFKNAVLT
jgi:hypothetical protein